MARPGVVSFLALWDSLETHLSAVEIPVSVPIPKEKWLIETESFQRALRIKYSLNTGDLVGYSLGKCEFSSLGFWCVCLAETLNDLYDG